MSTEVPEPWASVMIAAGLVDPRYAEARPSLRRLAEAASTTPTTISAMISGTRDTSGAIVQRVAVALKMERRADEVARWVGLARTQVRPFQPHRDADLLTAEEQEAVNELIRLLAAPKKQGGRAHGNAAATNRPGSRPDYELAADDGDGLTIEDEQGHDEHP